MLHLGSATDPPGYAWMLDLLCVGKPLVTWAAAGCLPAGDARAGQLVPPPSARGRSLLVPLASRRKMSSALKSSHALRSGRRKFTRQVLGGALDAGMARPVLRSRIDIGIRVGNSADQRADDLRDDQIRALCAPSLPAMRLVTAISGGQGPFRKPEAARVTVGAPDMRFYPSISQVLERQLARSCPEASPQVEGAS